MANINATFCFNLQQSTPFRDSQGCRLLVAMVAFPDIQEEGGDSNRVVHLLQIWEVLVLCCNCARAAEGRVRLHEQHSSLGIRKQQQPQWSVLNRVVGPLYGCMQGQAGGRAATGILTRTVTWMPLLLQYSSTRSFRQLGCISTCRHMAIKQS